MPVCCTTVYYNSEEKQAKEQALEQSQSRQRKLFDQAEALSEQTIVDRKVAATNSCRRLK
jgi:hypothetical protein